MVAAGTPEVSDTMITVPYPMSMERAQQWIARERFALLAGTAVTLAVRQKGHPALLGMVTVRNIDRVHSQGELAFWLDAQGRGKGYATEAAAALLHHAHVDIGLNRVEAYHMVRNPASGRVLARLGFQREGTLRARVQKNGVYEDVHLWARLRYDRLGPVHAGA